MGVNSNTYHCKLAKEYWVINESTVIPGLISKFQYVETMLNSELDLDFGNTDLDMNMLIIPQFSLWVHKYSSVI